MKLNKFFASKRIKKYLLSISLGLIFIVILGLIAIYANSSKKIFNKAQADALDSCHYLLSYDRDGAPFNTTKGRVDASTYLANNLARIESTTNFPYDGTVIISTAGNQVMTDGVVLNPTTVSEEFRPLREMTNKPSKLKHNLVRVLLHYPGKVTSGTGDFFDDASWTRVANNFKVLAQALDELDASGFPIDGIAFDNEGPYDANCTNKMWNYPSANDSGPNECIQNDFGNGGLILYQAKARARGKQVMDQMIKNTTFKDIRLMTFLDSYFSCDNNLRHNYDNFWLGNELLGSFTLGLTEATVGTSARVIDGGEYSYYADAQQMQQRYDYRKTGMPADPACGFMNRADSSSLYPNFTSLWSTWLKVGHGLMKDGTGTQTLASISGAVKEAMINSDDYVWIYTENRSAIDPLYSDPSDSTHVYVGQAWTDAVYQGKTDSTVPTNPAYCETGTTPSPPVPSLSPSSSSPPATRTLTITATLQGRTNPEGVIATLRINNLGGGGNLTTLGGTFNADGTIVFEVPDTVPAGSQYWLYLKPQYYLADIKDGVLISNTTNVTWSNIFSGGDLMDDNNVNSMDFALLNAHWLTSDPIADINGDGFVNSLDFAILNSNFGKGM